MAAILKNRNYVYQRPRLVVMHTASLPIPTILPNKTANIIKQNWNQFLLVVKATALKREISKFYSQILSTFVTGLGLV